MTTLKDIAELTGVSINTVSRALRDMPDIGASTKKRIRRAADTLNYTPNTVARGLVLKRTFIIGALVSELSNPARGRLLRHLRQALGRHGYQLLIESYDSSEEVAERLRPIVSRGIDGLIIGNLDGILAEKPYWPELQRVIASGVPVVTFFNATTTLADRVVCDYTAIADTLTTHLIEVHGLRRIHYAGMQSACSRADGYRQAMARAGLEVADGFIDLPYWSTTGTRDGMLAWLAERPPPEAIVCHNDLTAISVMAGLHSAGLRIPDDVAVVGTDNIDIAEVTQPPLTSAGFDADRVAEALIRLLLQRIDSDEATAARQVAIPFQLFPRQSCGCTPDPSPTPNREDRPS